MRYSIIYEVRYYRYEDVHPARKRPFDCEWAIPTSVLKTLPPPRIAYVPGWRLHDWEIDHSICIVGEQINEEHTEMERIFMER